MAKKWVPTQYVDEYAPPARTSPSAWIVRLPGDGVWALAGYDDYDGETDPIPLTEGQRVEFSWIEDFGTATFTVREDGSWTAEPSLPATPEGGAMHIMAVGDPDSMAWDMESFACGWIENDPEPGDILIRYYAWSERETLFAFRGGLFVEAEAVDDDLEHCGGCGQAIHDGDLVHVCMDGEPVLCLDCAYTWGELKTEVEDNPEREDRYQVLANIQAHLDQGGSLDDKCVHPWGMITAFVCHGPSSPTCKCRCPEGPCEHVWDGPARPFDDGHGETATCSRCGMAAVDHDTRVF